MNTQTSKDGNEVFEKILKKFTHAVETNDGFALANLFTENGVYHDGFYGAFAGRKAIASMLTDHFWGHAKDFRWHMFDALSNENLGYARYRFSYCSTIPGSEGKQVIFEGMSQFKFLEWKILEYHEMFNTGVALIQLDFEHGRIANHLQKLAKQLHSNSLGQ